MLTLPFRLAFSLFIALFCASSLVRRAVAGIAVSAAIVASQHEAAFQAFTASGSGTENASLVRMLLEMVAG